MKVTKLDAYDYSIHEGYISIRLASTNDPDLVDIMSELNRSKGKIYVEGHRFLYLDNYRLFSTGSESFIELDVEETA